MSSRSSVMSPTMMAGGGGSSSSGGGSSSSGGGSRVTFDESSSGGGYPGSKGKFLSVMPKRSISSPLPTAGEIEATNRKNDEASQRHLENYTESQMAMLEENDRLTAASIQGYVEARREAADKRYKDSWDVLTHEQREESSLNRLLEEYERNLERDLKLHPLPEGKRPRVRDILELKQIYPVKRIGKGVVGAVKGALNYDIYIRNIQRDEESIRDLWDKKYQAHMGFIDRIREVAQKLIDIKHSKILNKEKFIKSATQKILVGGGKLGQSPWNAKTEKTVLERIYKRYGYLLG